MPHRILKILYHSAVYAVGIIVLLVAIGVTIIRVLLPDIGIYRGEIEAWVSQYMGYPVAIRSLDATWEGWIPHLHLRDIDLLDRQGNETITHFSSARISIAPVATLLQRQIVPRHLLVSGFELSILRQPDGSIYIQGISLDDRPYSGNNRNELAEWLFNQNRIEITNGSVEWVDIRYDRTAVDLKDVHLLLRRDGERLQLEGSARLPGMYGDRMNFAYDGLGSLMTSDWSGELYIEGKNINPDNWYQQYRPFEFNITGGAADLRVWSSWENARLRNLQGVLNYADFNAEVGDKTLHVQNLDYEFMGEQRKGQDWRFSINLNDLVTEYGGWPDSSLEIAAAPVPNGGGYNYTARFSYLKLQDIVPLLGNLSLLPGNTRSMIENLDMQGNLINGEVRYYPGEEMNRAFTYDIHFEDFSVYAGRDKNRITGLSGHAGGTLHNGSLYFHNDSAALNLPSIRDEAIPVSDISGSLEWSRDKDEISLFIPLLNVSNKDITARLAGTVLLDANASPYLDMVIETGQVNLDKLKTYVPYTARFKMRPWMEKTVLGGELLSASALIRGRLSDFPYRDSNGKFKVIANIDKGVYEYSDKWPVVDSLNTEVVIDAMNLSARVNQGNVYDASLDNGRVFIPDLFRKQKKIFINGGVAGGISDLKTFASRSPLIEDISLRELNKSLTGGRFYLDLEMQVPFKIPGAKPQINGNIDLDQVSLASDSIGIELNELSGNIEFSNESILGSGLAATFDGIPVQIGINGTRDGEVSNTAITISGKADRSFITDQVRHYLSDSLLNESTIINRIAGTTRWGATLHYHKPADARDLQRSITLETDLRGLMIDMPAPLGKDQESEKRLRIVRNLDQSGPPLIELSYGNKLQADLKLSRIKDVLSLDGAHVHFGDGPKSTPPRGIFIDGHLDSLSVTDWWDFLRDAGINQGNSKKKPLRLELEIAELHLLSQNFSDVSLNISNPGDAWSLDVDSESIEGGIILPSPLRRESLATIEMDKLYLQRVEQSRHSLLEPHALPSLDVEIANFRYDNKELGTLKMAASPSEEGMTFDTISFRKPGMTIHGEGKWSANGSSDQSSFSIEAHADRIDTMLTTFGYDVTTIKNGETNLLIRADWEGTPMQFSLEKLNGSISMQVRDGQLLNVEPAAGRLFGLLSVQALPRRLTLDFRDLFSKGLAFDLIEGNFVVTNGDAYTNDLFMRGAAVDVSISGRTGLSQKDYDQRVTVTPQISESLPIAGAIFGPVGIGIGAIFYIAGEMFESLRTNIDGLLRYQYTITGSWEDPIVEKIKPAQEASG